MLSEIYWSRVLGGPGMEIRICESLDCGWAIKLNLNEITTEHTERLARSLRPAARVAAGQAERDTLRHW